jgi:hypothetical protein
MTEERPCRPSCIHSNGSRFSVPIPKFASLRGTLMMRTSEPPHQAGRLFFIGRKDDGGVRAHERIIEQFQGLWTDGQLVESCIDAS